MKKKTKEVLISSLSYLAFSCIFGTIFLTVIGVYTIIWIHIGKPPNKIITMMAVYLYLIGSLVMAFKILEKKK